MICDIMWALNFWSFHEDSFLYCHRWCVWCLGCLSKFNAVVHVAQLGHQSVNLVVSVAVVVLLLTFVKSCLFFEEVLDKGLLTVREFWGDSSFTGERMGLLARFESADDERLVVVEFVLFGFIFVRERSWTLFSLSWVRIS
jgi:hypothetical protein